MFSNFGTKSTKTKGTEISIFWLVLNRKALTLTLKSVIHVKLNSSRADLESKLVDAGSYLADDNKSTQLLIF